MNEGMNERTNKQTNKRMHIALDSFPVHCHWGYGWWGKGAKGTLKKASLLAPTFPTANLLLKRDWSIRSAICPQKEMWMLLTWTLYADDLVNCWLAYGALCPNYLLWWSDKTWPNECILSYHLEYGYLMRQLLLLQYGTYVYWVTNNTSQDSSISRSLDTIDLSKYGK